VQRLPYGRGEPVGTVVSSQLSVVSENTWKQLSVGAACSMHNADSSSNPRLSVPLLDQMVKSALGSLYDDLKTTNPHGVSWYRREQEVVSLFAFGHLVRLFFSHSLDTALLTIEGRVPQACGKKPKAKPKLRGQRDLVIWSQRLDGYWRNPDIPINPFAVIEWKLSTSNATDSRIHAEHEEDVEWFKKNSECMRVGYAVFVRWPNRTLNITCKRISKIAPSDDWASDQVTLTSV